MVKVIIRKYQDSDDWQEVTLEQAIDKLETSGYWKHGTVKDMLEDGQTVWNPFAQYKMVYKDESD